MMPHPLARPVLAGYVPPSEQPDLAQPSCSLALNVPLFTFAKTLTYRFGATLYRNGGESGPLPGLHLYVFYLKSGEVNIETDGLVRTYRAGQAGLVYSQQRLKFNYLPDVLSDMLWCSADSVGISPGIIKKVENLPCSLDHSDDLVTLLGMGVDTQRDSRQKNNHKTDCLGSALLVAYAYNASSRSTKPVFPICVLRVKKFIEQSFAEDHTLQSIAESFDINPRYLLKLYKQYLGVTPCQHLWDLRIEKALKLLFTSKLPISKIAALSGFKSPSHFSRYIKDNFNQPPGRLRDKFLSSLSEAP